MQGTSKCRCGKCDLDWTPELKTLAEQFDKEMFKRTGKISILTSGARCFVHNKNVGGKPDSEHTTGEGGDWHFYDSSYLFEMLDVLFNILHVTRIGINFNKNFVHWGVSKKLPQRVCWKY